VIVDLGASPIVAHAGYDFVYYERYSTAVPGIYMDSVVVEVCVDSSCSMPYTVFNWGDGVPDSNTSIGGVGTPSEPDNDPLPESALYGVSPYQVGIAIDVDAGGAPPGTYGYMRLSAPAAGGTVTDGAEVDAIEILPAPATATPTPTPVTGTTIWLYDDLAPLSYMMYPAQPSGSATVSNGDVTFYSEAAAGGEILPAGTITGYLNIRTPSAQAITFVLSTGSGASWTVIGSTVQTVDTGSVIQLITVPIGHAAHVFGVGEMLRFEVQGTFGALPNGLYWDGAYNDSRLIAPAIPATATPTPTSTPTATPTSAKIYWTDLTADKIQRSNLDGTGVEDLISTGLLDPRGIALDLGAGKMYWTDYGTDTIRRANLDGSGAEDLITTGLNLPVGLALDVAGGKMYWADEADNTIERSNLDGTGIQVLVAGLDQPYGLALDLTNAKIYWSDWGANTIQRSNLDGSSVEIVLSGLSGPRGLMLNLAAAKVYWSEWGSETIRRADLDGANVETLITGLFTPADIALDLAAGRLYFANAGAADIRSANLDGTGMVVLVSGLSDPRGVAR
jgi:sugar lactone lactonase YvrE